MNEEQFREEFMQLSAGISPPEIQAIFGAPDESNDCIVPPGSGWGTQDCFWEKIAAGERYLEWVYYRGTTHFTIWFAMQDDHWTISFRLPMPQQLRAKEE